MFRVSCFVFRVSSFVFLVLWESLMVSLENVLTWGACYSRERLELLYPEPRSLNWILTSEVGEWGTVGAKDRLWTVIRALPPSVARKWCIDCIEITVTRVETMTGHPESELREAINTLYVHGVPEVGNGFLRTAIGRIVMFDRGHLGVRQMCDGVRDYLRLITGDEVMVNVLVVLVGVFDVT